MKRETERDSKEFDIYRIEQQLDFAKIIAGIEYWQGLPYNFSYQRCDNSFYCADLIARAFPADFFEPRPMQFVGAYWNEYYRKLGLSIPEKELGYHPADMLSHPSIRFVGAVNFLSSAGQLPENQDTIRA